MSGPPLLVGIDIGTTSTKIALLEPETGAVTTRSAPVELHSPGPGQAEADPAQWWENVCGLLPPLLDQADGEVAAVATTGMVPALLVVDRRGAPLRPAMLQNDARAVAEIEALRAALRGIDVVATTGSTVSQQSIGPKHRWLVEHEPRLAATSSFLMGSYDWVALVLGAEPHVEENWALESGLYTLEGATLAPALEAAAIPPERLPRRVASGTPVGRVSSRAAEATGLPAGTPILAGGADHVLAAYAAGLTEPGDWLVKLGGAGDILAVSRDRLVDERLYLDRHPVPGLWLPNGCMATSGSLLRWLQQLVGGVELAELDREAQRAAPAAVLCLPYLLGEKSPLHDPDLRGAFVGLHLGHGRADLYRSALEAVAFGMREHVEIFEERSLVLGQAVVTNGGSGSTLWKQILADVLARPLATIAQSAGASLGAAVVAGVGAGVIASWDEPRRLARRAGLVEPEPARVRRYEEGYRRFREAREALTPLSHELARSQRAPAP